MRAGFVLIALLGCGGSPKPATPTPPPPPPKTDPTPPTTTSNQAPVAGQPTPQQLCKRLIELKGQRCGMFADASFDEAGCLKEVEASAGDPTIAVFGTCVAQTSCEEVQNCVVAGLQDLQKRQGYRRCDEKGVSAKVGVPAAEYAKRNGAGVTKYSQVVATKDKPVETCGVDDESEWLVQMTCNDGSHPIKSTYDAEGVRTGSVGQGGRCGSIIDQYVVKCPEKSYEIFMDAYICPNP